MPGQRPVAVVVRIQDEDGAVDKQPAQVAVVGEVKRENALADEGVRHVQQVEEEHREREKIRRPAVPGLTAHQFGRHEIRRANHTAGLSVAINVVVVAHADLAAQGIEEAVVVGDVAIREPVTMQFAEAGGELQADGREHVECGFDRSVEVVAQRAKPVLTVRHDVAERGVARGDGDVDGPEETVGGRAGRAQALQAISQSGIHAHVLRQEPLDHHMASGHDRAEHLSLAASADVLADRERDAPGLGEDLLARLKDGLEPE